MSGEEQLLRPVDSTTSLDKIPTFPTNSKDHVGIAEPRNSQNKRASFEDDHTLTEARLRSTVKR
jgi:hypothetical protein